MICKGKKCKRCGFFSVSVDTTGWCALCRTGYSDGRKNKLNRQIPVS